MAGIVDAAPVEIKHLLVRVLVDAWERTWRQATCKERLLCWAIAPNSVGGVVVLIVKVVADDRRR